MNTDLLLAHAHLKQALELAYKAEQSLYLDDLLRECEDCLMLSDRLLIAIDSAVSGCIDDIEAEYRNTNHKPKVTYVDFCHKEIL